jgi:hypothetical protein
MPSVHEDISKALKLIFEGIELLQGSCSNGRQFTIDGRLVGDIGELIAEREFAIQLDKVSRPQYDAKTLDGRDVQIKATFKDSLTFTTLPDLYLGLKLTQDGGHEVVFNGPGRVIAEAFGARKGFGEKQLSFPIRRLRELSQTVPEEERVPLRQK